MSDPATKKIRHCAAISESLRVFFDDPECFFVSVDVLSNKCNKYIKFNFKYNHKFAYRLYPYQLSVCQN